MMFDMTCKKTLGVDAIITNLMVPALTANSDARFEYTQPVGSNDFTIIHELDKYPSVTFVDITGEQIIGDVKYIDLNTVSCHFDEPFVGRVYLN